ncbi:methyltransferase domain-containing protein [Halioglobus sp. Uisw_031]|uniref:methyltransferase domain-containing protein n=1 Tax=Halioglobus sp. Uisw_031 TaxID=3230977 RepID=UPI0039EAD2AE
MKEFIFICKEIWKGHTILRAFLNLRLSTEMLRGLIIDIGGGRNSDYIQFMEKEKSVSLESFDPKSGQSINFEVDNLPAENSSYDTVLFLNVMEHIYNHKHIVNEVYRISREGGVVIGFVPFMMWYHADPSDYFRYTHECLERIFKEAGVDSYEIESISRGPFTVASHFFLWPLPRVLRVPMYLPFHLLDGIFLRLRPAHKDRYALGYFFKLKKMPVVRI